MRVTEQAEVFLGPSLKIDDPERPYDETGPTLSEVFDEIIATIPPDELAKAPRDGSERAHHYVLKARGLLR
jgi:hypothetical protein